MEYTYQYLWFIPFIPVLIPMLLGVGLPLFPTAYLYLREIPVIFYSTPTCSTIP